MSSFEAIPTFHESYDRDVRAHVIQMSENAIRSERSQIKWNRNQTNHAMQWIEAGKIICCSL